MNPFEKLHRGMGIGGWMTNYKRGRFLPEEKAFNLSIGDREHFERYLTRWDMQNIRAMGMDHIRIPFDPYRDKYRRRPVLCRIKRNCGQKAKLIKDPVYSTLAHFFAVIFRCEASGALKGTN